MAIIYTYPRLTNPDGTELIVVTETKNENATRILTVGDICNFCDSDACKNSFSTITTSSITPATAVGCDVDLTLESSDGSVTITNVGETIDFKANCLQRYILKPVDCEGEMGPCVLDGKSTAYEGWIYTCDPQFANHLFSETGEYINISPNPSDNRCWIVELEPSYTVVDMSCIECCEPLPSYHLTDCEDPDRKHFTTAADSPGIDTYVGQTVTLVEYAGCWDVTGPHPPEPVLTITTVIFSYTDCDCCANALVQEYLSCDTLTTYNVTITQPQLDDLLLNGVLSPYYTIRAVGASLECATWNGDSCVVDDGTVYEFWDSCEDEACSGSLRLTPCAGNPVGYTTTLYTTAAESPSVAAAIGDTVDIELSDSIQACYTIDGPGAFPPSTGSYIVYANYGSITGVCTCCVSTVKEYVGCNDGLTYYIDLNDPAVNIPGLDLTNPPTTIGVLFGVAVPGPPHGVFRDVEICMTFVACTDQPATVFTNLTSITEKADCDVTECLPWYAFRLCDDSTWTYTQTDLSTYAGINPLTNIWSKSEQCWEVTTSDEYEIHVPVGTLDLTGAVSEVDCDSCVYGPFVELTSCTDPLDIEIVSPLQFFGLPAISIGQVYFITSISFLSGCYEVTSINAAGPRTNTDNFTSNPLIAAGGGGLTACVCCESDLRNYIICPGAAGTTCNVGMTTTLVIDVNDPLGMNGVLALKVVAEDIATGWQCCYEVSEPASCVAPTGTYISTVTSCIDEPCGDLCTRDVRIYLACDNVCDVGFNPSLKIDINDPAGLNGVAAPWITAKDIISGFECCYELNAEIVPDCPDPSGIWTSTITDCTDLCTPT